MEWNLFYETKGYGKFHKPYNRNIKYNILLDSYLNKDDYDLRELINERKRTLDLINIGIHNSYKYKDLELRDYQNRNVAKLLFCKTFALFDKPGTGKTYAALAALREGYDEFKKVILIPAVKGTFKQWISWGKLYFDLDIKEIKGTPTERLKDYEEFKKADRGIILLTKEKIRQEYKEFEGGEYDLILIDEAHFLNNNSKTSKAITNLRSKCKYAWIFTGTPTDKNLLDMVGLMNFMYPSASYQQLLEHFGYPISTGFSIDYVFNESLRNELKEIRDLISSQTLITDAYSNFKDNKETHVYLKAEKEQKDYYNELLDNYIISNNEGKPINIFLPNSLIIETTGILDQMIRLQQLALDPRILIESAKPGIKTTWLINFIKENKDKQILIFSKSKRYIKLLEEDLTKLGVKVGSYHGDKSMNVRNEVHENFNNSLIKVLLVQNNAGGTGLRLQNADITIKVDLSWKPSDNEQIDGRMMNTSTITTKDKEVIVLYLKNSIDEYIKKALEEKMGRTTMVNNFKKYANML